MERVQPLRLLCHDKGDFYVCDPRSRGVVEFDIISYRWHGAPKHDVGIRGVDWRVGITDAKVDDIKRLMIAADIQYLWVDCVCINQEDPVEQSAEVAKMYEYYRSAITCHVLIDMGEVWDLEAISDGLEFVDHMLYFMAGGTFVPERSLTKRMTEDLFAWANTKTWVFPMDKTAAMSAGVEIGVLNCYAACTSHIRSLFDNEYFSRVWTFQEMLLGKNITLWSISKDHVSLVGPRHIWMDLATNARDKAYKLEHWIKSCRFSNPESLSAILRIVQEDKVSLTYLEARVQGINSARTDIICGGPQWWHDNNKGISNVFAAVSIQPRQATVMPDIFRGLLGVFNGLFTNEEIERELCGDNIDAISFAFFRQLSRKTGRAWTRLAISSRERREWNWIPVSATENKLTTTDCFSGVINLGRLNPAKGLVKTPAVTGLIGTPRPYMTIELRQGDGDLPFVFRGCNSGKGLKTGAFSSEPIHWSESPRTVIQDETGRILVQCATILGSLLNPEGDLVEYRRKFLYKLQPKWEVTNPNSKLADWVDRCVSGSSWEHPDPQYVRAHNRSLNYILRDVKDCQSRLRDKTTSDTLCSVRVNCGCTVVAPFYLIMEAIIAVDGSFLSDTYVDQDKDHRTILQDGLGLVQVGDGKAFHLVAFNGSVNSHPSYAAACRITKQDSAVVAKLPWPRGRALVRADFRHEATNLMRDYGYVETGGFGNLLICRNSPADNYKIIGVCIDEFIQNKKGYKNVTIG